MIFLSEIPFARAVLTYGCASSLATLALVRRKPTASKLRITAVTGSIKWMITVLNLPKSPARTLSIV